jgi:hypothetical protein
MENATSLQRNRSEADESVIVQHRKGKNLKTSKAHS